MPGLASAARTGAERGAYGARYLDDDEPAAAGRDVQHLYGHDDVPLGHEVS